ncbi:hypothetical protein [Streptomyces sp. NPDC093591]|uniref:hypothetical protein n=1 Tax=Streptomyces sp. NPDC093591 TaxID=3366044 RepID=UPI00381F1AFC
MREIVDDLAERFPGAPAATDVPPFLERLREEGRFRWPPPTHRPPAPGPLLAERTHACPLHCGYGSCPLELTRRTSAAALTGDAARTDPACRFSPDHAVIRALADDGADATAPVRRRAPGRSRDTAARV